MRSLRVLSRLLAYPNAELQDQMEALKDLLISDGFLKKKTLRKLIAFMDELAAADLMDAQENYVEIFDRGRAHSLHLFEHVHGESRLRGQAMLDLSSRYAEMGLEIGVGELPDYLPLFLEFISVCEPQEGLETLAQATTVIATIGEKLRRKNSGYAQVFASVVELSGAKLKQSDIQKAADKSPPEIKTLDELDEEWQEPAAFGSFGINGADCSTCGQVPLERASQKPDLGAGQ